MVQKPQLESFENSGNAIAVCFKQLNWTVKKIIVLSNVIKFLIQSLFENVFQDI